MSLVTIATGADHQRKTYKALKVMRGENVSQAALAREAPFSFAAGTTKRACRSVSELDYALSSYVASNFHIREGF